ncbi:hypothetical protein DFS34DRAFT_644034 [Phlyctochytrium arcticum]|nr:hypothetical protein DFS34DRAFT_644034 [Phlyctochytrium arcticum]
MTIAGARLPPEVLVGIITNVTDLATLLNLASVCRWWRTTVLPQAYRPSFEHPKFHDDEDFRTFLDILEAYPKLGCHISCFDLPMDRKNVDRFASLLKYCPNILEFSIDRDSYDFSEDGDFSLNDEFIVALADNCKSLERLCIPGCDAVAILAVAANCPLSDLDVSFSNADDKFVRALLDVCPCIGRLTLSGCTGISEEAVFYIFDNAECLHFLNVGGCKVSDIVDLQAPEHIEVELTIDW